MEVAHSNPTPLTLDLTGLPDPVVELVRNIVAEARGEIVSDDSSDTLVYPKFISRPRPTPEESKRILDEMASMSSGQSLPVDFSTADIYDIYDDHD